MRKTILVVMALSLALGFGLLGCSNDQKPSEPKVQTQQAPQAQLMPGGPMLKSYKPDAPAAVATGQKRPNILVIWGDDIGVHNVSAYNHGIMGYRTPNIDRLAREGALFTDAYAQQSCTCGPGLLYPGTAAIPHRLADHRHARFATRHT